MQNQLQRSPSKSINHYLMKKILYVGPSWAARSYDTPDGLENNYTNLIEELKLDVDNYSRPASTNLFILNKIIPKNYQEIYSGIIWVYAEPIGDLSNLHRYTSNLSNITPTAFIESENFWQMREDINRYILKEISKLNCPIGIIGSHSDINDCKYKNISIIHSSWQKFLANQIKVKLDDGWGVEIAHRYIMTEYKEVKPSYNIIDKISDTFLAWHKMELNKVFNGCHPNKKGNELFAKEIQNSVQSFINNL